MMGFWYSTEYVHIEPFQICYSADTVRKADLGKTAKRESKADAK
jgi:hypothetical protein